MTATTGIITFPIIQILIIKSLIIALVTKNKIRNRLSNVMVESLLLIGDSDDYSHHSPSSSQPKP